MKVYGQDRKNESSLAQCMTIHVWDSLKVSQEGTVLSQLCKAREDTRGLCSDAEMPVVLSAPLGRYLREPLEKLTDWWGTYGVAR